MAFAELMVALAGPMAKRAAIALGIGIVSTVGMSAVVDGLLGQVKSSWGGMSADVAVYLAMGGVNTGLSLIAGALVTRVALLATKGLSLL